MSFRTTELVEHQPIVADDKISPEDIRYLRSFATEFLKFKGGELAASKYVGILTTPSGLAIEILPKIDFASTDDPGPSRSREVFLKMLRRSRVMPQKTSNSLIRDLRNFPMLTYFIRQFLHSLTNLVHEGLARKYVLSEGNLPYLRGRILFNEQVRINHTNEAMYYVSFSELSENRPVNRLIVSTLHRLDSIVDYGDNRKLLNNLKVMFADVPASQNVMADWQRHSVDRSMRHYTNVMQWIGLFLFNRGLSTYAGKHSNLSLLFPMERVFEDFVTDSLKRYQSHYAVRAQQPQQNLTILNQEPRFTTKPDIALMEDETVRVILDAKWKRIDQCRPDKNFYVEQSDLYQLYTYGKRYDCKAVVLIYPKSGEFNRALDFRYFDDLRLVCYPFDVEDPHHSVESLISHHCS